MYALRSSYGLRFASGRTNGAVAPSSCARSVSSFGPAAGVRVQVLDEQHLRERAAHGARLAVGRDRHALADTLGAGGHRPRRSLHLDEAHAAAAVRVELVVVAERRDEDAVPCRRMDEQLALGRGHRLAVEGELDHRRFIVSRHSGDGMIPACSRASRSPRPRSSGRSRTSRRRSASSRHEVELYGNYKAKVGLSVLDRLAAKPDAKLVCVTAITPTKAGEGKTTTSVSLTQGLGKIGKRPVLCLREASLGPVFGIKGGAAGGGYAQVVPMEDLNLHFTGDIHAIGAANNLLSAMLEASILHLNPLRIDPLRVSWRRCMDMNDRALREIVIGLRGRANGYVRETGFDITAASEVMAIAAVARDLQDLRRRLGRDHGRVRLERRARDCRSAAGSRRDDRAPEGCDQAEPRADARGAAGIRPLRPVREHRTRQQLARRRPRGAQARRLRRHRERVRRPTWAWRSSSTSSVARAGSARARSCSSPPSGRSSTTAASPTVASRRSSVVLRTSRGISASSRSSG